MRILSDKRCIIGEGPIWNADEGRLYFTNAYGNEICMLDWDSGAVSVRPVSGGAAAFAFDRANRLIISCKDGVYYLNEDGSRDPLYDPEKYTILHANDMKVGPDGRIYVGTQSRRRLRLGDELDGRLYCIAPDGTVRVLLEKLILSNGMDWSPDERFFYHTDSDTKIIREYAFDGTRGEISYTGREVHVPGVDGFAAGMDGKLYIACWGQGHIAIADMQTMCVTGHIPVPARAPASCAFAGPDLRTLVTVTASYRADIAADPHAGFTFVEEMPVCGRQPYRFGAGKNE